MTHNYFAAWHGKFQVKSRAAEQVLFTSSSGFCVVVSMKVKSVGKHFMYRQELCPRRRTLKGSWFLMLAGETMSSSTGNMATSHVLGCAFSLILSLIVRYGIALTV